MYRATVGARSHSKLRENAAGSSSQLSRKTYEVCQGLSSQSFQDTGLGSSYERNMGSATRFLSYVKPQDW